MTDQITNTKLYDKVEGVRLEIKGDIVRLESKFDAIVNTEIAKLRDEVNTIKIKYATLTTKLGILGFISASVIGAIISVLINKVAT